MTAPETIEQLIAACDSLMGELTGKKVANWGLINTALVNGRLVLKDYYARIHRRKTRNIRYGKLPK